MIFNRLFDINLDSFFVFYYLLKKFCLLHHGLHQLFVTMALCFYFSFLLV